MMNILGISAFYHDSAASLIRDGVIMAAAQEERFTRKKHDPSFPVNALRYCLDRSNLQLSEVDYITFYDKPFLTFERLMETYVTYAPRGFKSFKMAFPLWIKDKLFLKKNILNQLKQIDPRFTDEKKLLFSEHHLSHAASAFYPSPYHQAAVLTMDGVGEWATTSLALGDGNSLKIDKELHFPHSIGLLYSAFTYYTGFKVNSGEYKVMGLAPYGKPIYKKKIYDNLIDIKSDGSFRLNQDYFDYCTGLKMTNNRFDELFGGPPRQPEDNLEQKHMDLAASIQVVTEELVIGLARNIQLETGMKNLCLAGGVALNCVANGKLLESGTFENIWIQPAAGDAGGAIGAALYTYHQYLGKARETTNPSREDSMSGSYLGPSYSTGEIEKRLSEKGAVYETLGSDALLDTVARELAEGKAVGWFQGRMEFGPRALGGRSIIADSRSPEMQKMLNLKVKFRESFRPFAPSVLSEDISEWFEMSEESPYMLLVARVAENKIIPMSKEEHELFGIQKLNVPRSRIPAITHVDYSARIQTVHKKTNPKYYELINRFKKLTGCPILVNTSFNVRGEPIVCSPEDAFRCFMGTGLDLLVLEDCILYKSEQDPKLKKDYKESFELD